MIRIIISILPFLLWQCHFQLETPAQSLETLEKKLDSLEEKYIDPSPELINRILVLDSNNFRATKIKGISFFNDRLFDSSIYYLKKALAIDSNDPLLFVLVGWSFERLNNIEKRNANYKAALRLINEDWANPWMKAHLTTILHGRESGLANLENEKDKIGARFYYWSFNDIKNYDGYGMSGFFPLLFDHYDSSEFQITIPKEIYESGKVNSMRKVCILFGKLGVNVWVKSSSSADYKYTLTTSKRYLEKLMILDTLGLEKL